MLKITLFAILVSALATVTQGFVRHANGRLSGPRHAFQPMANKNLFAEEPVPPSRKYAPTIDDEIRIHPGEYDPIEGLLLGRNDRHCADADVLWEGFHDWEYSNTVDQAHRKLIKSAVSQGVEVFYQVSEKSEEACLERVTKWLRDDLQLSDSQVAAKVHIASNPKLSSWKGPNIWIRDYAPIWVLSGSENNRTSHAVKTKYWGRFTENTQTVPKYINSHLTASSTGQPFKRSEVDVRKFSLEAGNFMSNSEGLCISSASFLMHNSISEADAKKYYASIFGCKLSIFLELLPLDGTKHIDMYVSFAKTETILFGMYQDSQHAASANVTRANKAKLEKTLKAHGLNRYKIVEVPMPDPCDSDESTGTACSGIDRACPLYTSNPACTLTSLSQCTVSNLDDNANCVLKLEVPGRTYVNLLPLNDELHIPVFAKDTKYEEQALDIIARETGKRIVKHDGDVLAYYSGSIHCITKQIPRGGLFQEMSHRSRWARSRANRF